MGEKIDVRELFPAMPWTEWERDAVEADHRLRERMSNVQPDWYDTLAGLLLGWLLIGAVGVGVMVGLVTAPVVTLLAIIAVALVLAVVR